MKCPKCSADLPAGAPVCPKCMTPVAQIERPTATAKKRFPLGYILVAAGTLILIILAALILRSIFSDKSVTQAENVPAPPAQSVTNAPPPAVTAGPSVTNAPPPQAPPPAPPIQTPPEKKVPKEVVDYLNFLQQVERTRQALLKDTMRAVGLAAGQAQADSLMDMLNMAFDDNAPSTQQPKRASGVEKELSTHMQNWNQLVRYFDSVPAPQQCSALAGNYRAVLTTETSRINAICTTVGGTNWSDMDSIKKSLSQLEAMKTDPNLQGGIDKAVETADTSLGDICTFYGITKPFEVKKEGDAGGSIIGGGM
jgi:hypothetical protein